MLFVGGRGVGVRKGDLESVVDRRCSFLQKGEFGALWCA